MELHDEVMDELRGDGMIIIDGHDVAMIPYSLTLAPEPGNLVGEGSICGPEPLLQRVKKAKGVKLALENGPVVTLRCRRGGHRGLRWVKALKA